MLDILLEKFFILLSLSEAVRFVALRFSIAQNQYSSSDNRIQDSLKCVEIMYYLKRPKVGNSSATLLLNCPRLSVRAIRI